MSKLITIAVLAITIRRDANTITPSTVPEHELPLVRNMFGKENVVTVGESHTMEVDPSVEHERLSAKYGPGIVAKVYGDDDGLRLAEMAAKNEIKPEAAKTKAAAKSAAKAEAEAAAAEAAE